MARATSMEVLEQKIEKAQVLVSRKKKEYDAAISALSDLLDKRDAIRRDELVKAILKSNRTYEEVIAFLETDSGEDE
jgi:flagellar biosynthesis chaperone FliJ